MFGQQLKQLLEVLDIETLDTDLFRGGSPRTGRDRIFGGQVMAQSLVAAHRTVEDRLAHSFHCYFLRPGDPERPILFRVERTRDGRSFTSRRVTAHQRGEVILDLAVSYHAHETGLEHQLEAAPPGEPEGVLYEDEIKAMVERQQGPIERDDRRFDLPIEVRTLGGLRMFDGEVRAPRTETWMRTKGPLPDDPALHQALLAYASDLTLLVSAVNPHPVGMTTPGFRSASLDHAMWFHAPFRTDEWLFCDQESPVTGAGRGFALGRFFTREGRLVATCTQEGLVRYRPDEGS